MDFFEQQERSRRKTRWLLVYFVLVMAVLAVAVYLVLATFAQIVGLSSGLPVLAHAVGPDRLFSDPLGFLKAIWRWDGFGAVAAVLFLVIGFATLYKIHELAQGGSVVAVMLGGRPVAVHSQDADEQKLHNVVEEMAIASGVPIPELYILDGERGINAFAAGHAPSDTVVGVTRGAIKTLTREELQGVVAHEFSHILNGDTRLNMRLMGLAFGILCLAVLGRWLAQIGVGWDLDEDSDWGSQVRVGRGRGSFAVVALGVLLLVIGSIGVFFARLIKSAVSRQREFLADAAAVQMTRNPVGLVNALKKIGGSSRGARLLSAHAENASHLFFGNGLADSWFRWLATHPPLEDRIRAIDPTFDGVFPEVPLPESPPVLPAATAAPPPVPARIGMLRPDQFIAAVGLPAAHHLDHAAAMRVVLPEAATQAARDPAGAVALVYALLLGPEGEVRAAQLRLLDGQTEPAVAQEVLKLAPEVAALPPHDKLPLIDLTIPALRRLAGDQYERFMRNVQALIESDRQIDLFEYTLQRILRRRLQPRYEAIRPTVIQFYALKPLLPDCAVLLSALAQMGQEDPAAVEAAFRQGAMQLGTAGVPLELLDANDCNLQQVDAALTRLAQATPLIRKNLLYACAHTVAADGQVQEREAELLRAIADSLDCPVPPLVAST